LTVVENQYGGIAGSAWVHLSGTIAEVLQELADKGINAAKLVWYTDDATDARAVYCKLA
jgi:hypothetical protein